MKVKNGLDKKKVLIKEILRLGHFVYVCKNGKFEVELDLYDDRVKHHAIGIVESIVFGDLLYANGYKDIINLIMSNGDIIEFKKSPRRYIKEQDIKEISKKIFTNSKLVREDMEQFWCQDTKSTERYVSKRSIKKYISLEELEGILTDCYRREDRYGDIKTIYRPIYINDNNIILFNYYDVENESVW